MPKIWAHNHTPDTSLLVVISIWLEHFLLVFLNPWGSFGSYLFEDVLFSHQFLSLSVGFGHSYIQDRLTAIDDISHKENHVLKQLDGKPDQQSHWLSAVPQGLPPYLLLLMFPWISFRNETVKSALWTWKPNQPVTASIDLWFGKDETANSCQVQTTWSTYPSLIKYILI